MTSGLLLELLRALFRPVLHVLAVLSNEAEVTWAELIEPAQQHFVHGQERPLNLAMVI